MHSYMITNRRTPGWNPIEYLDRDKLWWYEAPSINEQDPSCYKPHSENATKSPPDNFTSAIQDQLKAQADPNLIVFIHGLSTDWDQSVTATATLGSNLANQGYQGLVIGFSWPSFGTGWAELKYASAPYEFPPKPNKDRVRGNIGGSIGSFQNFFTWLASWKSKVTNLTTSVVCHSEGNFMQMCGMNGFQDANIDNCLLMAADFNTGAFITPGDPNAGQGLGISNNATEVTVYYSLNDYVLADATGGYYKYHNPSFVSRMGLSGPAYAQGAIPDNVYSVDCSPVVNLPNLDTLINAGTVPSDTSPHTSYLYVPQVLDDIIAVTTNAGSIANRSPGPYSGSFIMDLAI
jgi:hypothetical protein